VGGCVRRGRLRLGGRMRVLWGLIGRLEGVLGGGTDGVVSVT